MRSNHAQRVATLRDIGSSAPPSRGGGGGMGGFGGAGRVAANDDSDDAEDKEQLEFFTGGEKRYALSSFSIIYLTFPD
jgi:hypothetical protein